MASFQSAAAHEVREGGKEVRKGKRGERAGKMKAEKEKRK
jgi:hypothetical protein